MVYNTASESARLLFEDSAGINDFRISTSYTSAAIRCQETKSLRHPATRPETRPAICPGRWKMCATCGSGSKCSRTRSLNRMRNSKR